MHHKRGKPKTRRAGCLMCKPHKVSGTPPIDSGKGPGKTGFGKIRDEYHRKLDLKEETR
jgi:hypothetical protein